VNYLDITMLSKPDGASIDNYHGHNSVVNGPL